MLEHYDTIAIVLICSLVIPNFIKGGVYVLKRLIQTLSIYAVAYTTFYMLEYAGVGEGKKIFFFTYLVLVVTFSTFCIFPLVNYKRIEIEGGRDSKFTKFVYSILIISVTALPIFISMVMTLLFKGLDIFMSFAILETFVYAAFAFFYVAFCDDAKAVSEEQHVFKSNCILFDDARKMKKLYK